MVTTASGIDTVVVRVGLAPPRAEEPPGVTSSGDDESPRTYIGLVYSKLDLPLSSPMDPPPGAPSTWGAEPLSGIEPFVVDWAQYGAYLASFVEGGKRAVMMWERLFEALPQGLSSVLEWSVASSGPSRTWFDTDAPELAELPWELLAYRDGHRAAADASFVRGLPPATATPLVPITGRLRLGVIDPTQRAPRAFASAVDSISADLKVRYLSSDVRSALKQAAEEGLELVHIVADGSVTSSLDGVLEFPGAHERPLSAREVGSKVRGSRIRMVGLTPAVADPASTSIGPWVVPSAHRAFTYFATSPSPLPSIVAPLGPVDDFALELFWRTFYANLADSHQLEASMVKAQAQQSLAMALFLRQLQVPTFRHVPPAEQPSAEPSAVHAELAASRELVEEIQNLKKKLDLKTDSLDAFTERETVRQSQLESEVSQWVEGVDEE